MRLQQWLCYLRGLGLEPYLPPVEVLACNKVSPLTSQTQTPCIPKNWFKATNGTTKKENLYVAMNICTNINYRTRVFYEAWHLPPYVIAAIIFLNLVYCGCRQLNNLSILPSHKRRSMISLCWRTTVFFREKPLVFLLHNCGDLFYRKNTQENTGKILLIWRFL